MMMVATRGREQAFECDELIVGNSPAVRALRQIIARVAQSSASVMITGPSGSGKELVAQAIHAASTRAGQAFVALNCGAIPAELMESELFGHERGAFTGAATRRIGRFEEANKGTLFLDEIGDMRFDMQVKLLRVLEDGLIQRVGGGAPIASDVRIISATHQNIDAAICENRFREDLYFRLGVVPINVPSLAERVEDIPLLIEHFRKTRAAPARAQFDRDAMMRLMAHEWPGNIRELRNVVERADILFGGMVISAEEVEQLLGLRSNRPLRVVDLQARIAARAPVADMPIAAPKPVSPKPVSFVPAVPAKVVSLPIDRNAPIDLKVLIETVEQERIQMALEAADGVISEAARLLTLKRTTLIEKMRKYGVGKQAA